MKGSLAIALIAVGVESCGGESDADSGRLASEPAAIEAAVAFRIGELDGPDEYLFGDITSVAVDASGLIYVADRIGSSVRVFRETGEFLAWVGREGDGPGEFQWPNDIFASPDGRLIVRDGNRITTIGRSAASEFPDSVVATWSLPGYSNLDSRRGRLAGDVYFYPSYLFSRGEPPRFNYWLFGQEGFLGDTVWVPPLSNLEGQETAYYMVSQGSGRMVDGLSSGPFAPRATWDVTSRGTIIASEGSDFALLEYGTEGQLLRTIPGRDATLRPVPSGERADTLAALRIRIDSLPVPLDEVLNVAPAVRRGDVPEVLPAVTAVHVGVGDRLWVQRWPDEGRGSSRFFDVLEYDGDFAFAVVVAAPLLEEPAPFFGTDVVVGVVSDEATDVQAVVVVRLPG